MRMTLDETWNRCLVMWKYVAEESKKENPTHPGTLKEEWLKKRQYKKMPKFNCFFCEYTIKDIWAPVNCSKCPGRLVNRKFQCETHKTYHWMDNPVGFYNELVSLNRKQLKAKK